MSSCINHTQKWGYIHIPKTGGTTISNILNYTGKLVELEHNHSPINRFPPDYFLFTFVRNPFTRYISSYYHETRKGRFKGTFKEFTQHTTKNIVFKPQTYFIKHGETDNRKVHFIGRYENLLNDINSVLEKTGNRKISLLPHLNRNPIYDKHPTLNQQEYYKLFYKDEYIKEYVRQKYKEDFINFGYELDF